MSESFNIGRHVYHDKNAMKEIYYDKNQNMRVLKEVEYKDKNGNGKFETNEITHVTIFGYSKSGDTGKSYTYSDENGDGYSDPTFYSSTYKKNKQGEYVKTRTVDIGDMTVEEMQREASRGYDRDYWKGLLNNHKMENIAGEKFLQRYKSVSDGASLEELFPGRFD